MKQRFPLFDRILIVTLRRQIEEAYSRGDLHAALALTCQMDGIQILRWQRQLSRAS